MPFRSDRLKHLREAKGWSKEQLAERAALSRPMITKSERGKNSPRSETLDHLAQALDCTTDYLLGRGPDYESPSIAAVYMAFEVFIAQQPELSNDQRERCRRALPHPNAPKTAEEWRSLAEMMDLALGSTSGTSSLSLVGERRAKAKPMATARQNRG